MSESPVSDNTITVPRFVRYVLAGVLVAGVVSLLASATPFTVIRGYLDSLSGDGSADPYTESLHARLRTAALLLGLLLLAVSIGLWKTRSAWAGRATHLSQVFLTDLRELRTDLFAPIRENWVAILILTLAAAGLRLPYLSQPMRYDEAHSYLEYSGQPWFVTLSKYDAPNNHVGHNVLVYVSTRLLGNSPEVIRLPAFLAGILLVSATFLLTVTLNGTVRSALFSALIVTVSSALVEYSTNARGYTLITLLTVSGWIFATVLTRTSRPAAWMGLIACGAFGLWTVPVMAYPLSMIWVWLWIIRPGPTFSRKEAVRRLLSLSVAGSMVILSAAVLYLPVLLVSGPKALVANPYVQPKSLSEFAAATPNGILESTEFLARDFPLPVVGILALSFFWGLADKSNENRQAHRFAATSLIVCFALVTLQRVIPPPRVWTFLVPLGAVGFGLGIEVLIERYLKGSLVRIGWTLAALLAGVWPAFTMVQSNSVLRSEQTGTVTDARAIVEFLKENVRDREPVITACPSSAPVKYYAMRAGFDMHHFDWPGTEQTRGDIALLIQAHSMPQTVDSILASLKLDESYSADDFTKVKGYSSATLYRVESKSPSD